MKVYKLRIKMTSIPVIGKSLISTNIPGSSSCAEDRLAVENKRFLCFRIGIFLFKKKKKIRNYSNEA